jgi:uracil-DNA glycosylase
MLLVGEAFGASEELHQAPFVGHSGKELFRMLGDAGTAKGPEYDAVKRFLYVSDELFLAKRSEWLRANGIALTNVFNVRPSDNKLDALCGPSGKGLIFDGRTLPPLVKSPRHLYMREEFCGHLARLKNEVGQAKPNLVVALGAAALWGLTAALKLPQGQGAHSETRGTVQPGPPKLLPTFHPAYVLRQWNARSVTVSDLIKAWRESTTPVFARPPRRVLINPELDDIRDWATTYIRGDVHISTDIETKGGQITSIGFATSRSEAIVVPFVLVGEDPPMFRSYWRTASDELVARGLVRAILRNPFPKTFQNGLYDIQWLIRDGYPIRNAAEDTMLLHHAIHPEMRKGLGFLGSLYTSEVSWKIMRQRNRDETAKVDD